MKRERWTVKGKEERVLLRERQKDGEMVFSTLHHLLGQGVAQSLDDVREERKLRRNKDSKGEGQRERETVCSIPVGPGGC